MLDILADRTARHERVSTGRYGRIGDLEVRLAADRADIRAAQRLRYQVFYEEMAAKPTTMARVLRLDQDLFDTHCDHLLVVDSAASAAPANGALWQTTRWPCVVGTYRLLRHDIAARRGITLYTAGEYDIAPLIAARGPATRFLEVGRSCVLAPYRTGKTLAALWHGLWTYARMHGIDVMIGCASFPGTDPAAHAEELAFLHHHCRAPVEWRARAHAAMHVAMDRLPVEAIDPRAALKSLPPLIKGYLRLGAWVGDGAVVDHQFGTTDVLIILPVTRIDPRYFERFGMPGERVARIG